VEDYSLENLVAKHRKTDDNSLLKYLFKNLGIEHGDCRGFAAVRINKGHFGEVGLDGLGAALLYAWPGPIYEGNGECQAVIDERASGKQRDALATVLYGGETNEAATHWWVYRTMSSTVHPPLFKHIVLCSD
jgi:hypothetical protein